ncbi:hypothetical protein PPTG_00649 [Phytophthora nicotianae INRA-310]|uniref:Cyclic nucleotide-binding domain-containing protein n=1 Tax=Phytophthora nicotianae (strain INRA-310) TaxID=761204 RepID=W2RFL5_PHYN3|nr:hypothetical protein PPTG_00649 [Phytophthora nicotianae INRA-310]ETN24233.1 hypothetical protein PPTG_00649 [Phytophthora nicotianae INRA-310]
MEEGDVTASGETPRNRRRSLASQMEEMTSDGAFMRVIARKGPQVNLCRTMLHKPTGKRTLEDIHVLKSLFGSSKLLQFFSNLDAFKLDRLYQSLELVAYAEKGAYVFHEGDDGDSFYLVYTGRVEVVKKEVGNPTRPNGTIHLAFLGPGDTFGERALLSSTDVRSASVIISTAPTELVFINRVVFSELLKESHDSSNTANTLEITKRFRSNKDIVRNIFMRSSAQRSEKDLKFAVEYLKSVKFFSRFSFEVRKQLCKVLRLISAVTNTVLFAEGQVGRHFYIIFSGCVDVSVRTKNRFDETKESVVSRLGEGEYFGELALSQADGVRRATVLCTEFCELLILGRDEYEPLIKKYQNEYHAQYAQMLRKNPYFIGPEWDDNTIEGMCSVMTEKYIPFKGEICKQGSRASELFIVTRGECRIIHEGKHPITNARQIYELGRYGPNSVLGCAEASAGKFNDIFIREYSILAESPMKILVLSRFDIFHLMSADARASLQRSSNGYIRESIQSRAIKSLAWEKYKKSFIGSVMAENQHHLFGTYRGGHSDGAVIPTQSSTMLGKSQSAPLLPLSDARTLVDPGSLMLERRRGVGKTSAAKVVRSTSGSQSSDQQNNRESAKSASGVDEPQTGNGSPPPVENSDRSPIPQENGNIKATRSASGSSLLRRGSSVTPAKLQQAGNRAKLPPVAHEDSTPSTQSSLTRYNSSKSLNRRVNGADGSNVEKSARSLLPAVSPIKEANEESSSTKEYRSDLRRCGRVRAEKIDNTISGAKNGPAGTSTGVAANAATIWDPVHGVCQPFAVLGFMKEQATRPASRGMSLSLSSAGKLSKSAKSAADQLRKVAAAVSAAGHAEFTRFRVFGKFRDIDDALNLFRQICAVEKTAGQSDGQDCSRFAIYKEDEMTMALENFPSVITGEAKGPIFAQFSAADLPQATGQRFACVSVSLQSPRPACIEAIVVHVYQCFPTPQSAVRFARQVAATLLAPGALSIVPLFEWIPLTELERFDARNNDLEQELELAMRRGGRESTWKARKEAIKKVIHQHKLKSPT